jgi:prepilin peptidase CpaA
VKHINIKLACLVVLLLLAVWKDLNSYKISNQLILIGIIIGFLFNLFETAWTGVVIWFGGIFLPVILLIVLFLFKVLGAGDIKLFSVVGGFFGASYVVNSIVIAFFAAAVLSLIQLIKYKQVRYRFHYFISYIQKMIQINQFTKQGIRNFKIIPYYDIERDGYKGVIHFSAAILSAVLIQTFFHF